MNQLINSDNDDNSEYIFYIKNNDEYIFKMNFFTFWLLHLELLIHISQDQIREKLFENTYLCVIVVIVVVVFDVEYHSVSSHCYFVRLLIFLVVYQVMVRIHWHIHLLSYLKLICLVSIIQTMQLY